MDGSSQRTQHLQVQPPPSLSSPNSFKNSNRPTVALSHVWRYRRASIPAASATGRENLSLRTWSRWRASERVESWHASQMSTNHTEWWKSCSWPTWRNVDMEMALYAPDYTRFIALTFRQVRRSFIFTLQWFAERGFAFVPCCKVSLVLPVCSYLKPPRPYEILRDPTGLGQDHCQQCEQDWDALLISLSAIPDKGQSSAHAWSRERFSCQATCTL